MSASTHKRPAPPIPHGVDEPDTDNTTAIDLDEIVTAYVKLLDPKRHKDISRIIYDQVRIKTRTDFTEAECRDLPKESVLFKTVIEPETGTPMLKFVVNRKSKTTAKIEVHQGLSTGHNLKVPFTIPPQIANEFTGKAGFTRNLYLDQSNQTEETEEIEWCVEASITADNGKTTEFSVLLQEKEYSAQFTSTTSISGSVRVECTTQDGQKVIYIQPKKVWEMIFYLKQENVQPKLPQDVIKMLQHITVENGAAKVKMTGKCQFRYGVNTKIITSLVDT